jgi:hypothetical protein
MTTEQILAAGMSCSCALRLRASTMGPATGAQEPCVHVSGRLSRKTFGMAPFMTRQFITSSIGFITPWEVTLKASNPRMHGFNMP